MQITASTCLLGAEAAECFGRGDTAGGRRSERVASEEVGRKMSLGSSLLVQFRPITWVPPTSYETNTYLYLHT